MGYTDNEYGNEIQEIRQRKIRRIRQRRRRILLRRRCMVFGIAALLIWLSVHCCRREHAAGGEPALLGDSTETEFSLWRRSAKAEVEIMEDDGKEYPVSLLELLKKNPETEEFVMHYHEYKDKQEEIDLSGEITRGTIPLFLQWDERWGYEIYGSDFMALTGCGPTCLSMVYCGLTGDSRWDPLSVASMAQEEGFYVSGAGSSWSLMSKGAEILGLTVKEIIYDEFHILAALEEQIPIICVMGPGDFTTSGHFIVLTGVEDEGQVKLCDPNSRINSEKIWDIKQIIPQIKNLWGYEAG